MSLSELKTQRGILQGNVTRLQTYISKLDKSNLKDIDYIEIEDRIDSVKNVLSDYQEIQTKIEALDGGDIKEASRTKFEDKYFKTLSEAKLILRGWVKIPPVQPQTVSTDTNTSLHDKVRLPQLSLPEFHGLYSEWLSFYNTFTSLVENNTHLSKTDKFYYLKGCLRDQAAQVIHSLQITDENYDVAIKLLKDRFENKKLIVHTHVRAIFDLFPLKNESFNSLRKLLDNFNKNMRALEALKQDTEHWDTLLIYILSSKLDPTTKREWEETANKKDEFPTLKDLTDFLTKRCNVLEALETKNKFAKFSIQEKTVSHVVTQSVKCAFCGSNHYNFHCEKFQKLSTSERQNLVDKNKLCGNCLRPGHYKRDCKSRGCKLCNLKHNTLLHPSETNNYSPHQTNKRSVTQNQVDNKHITSNIESTLTLTQSLQVRNQVLLATAKILIRDTFGNLIMCRALLDSASQSCFITRNLADQLKLKTCKIRMPVSGINNSLTNISDKLETTIFSVNGLFNITETFLIIPKITENMPLVSFDFSHIQIPEYVSLADDEFHISGPIDILLGASIFFNILCSSQVKLGKNYPVLQKTKLGWILSGPIGRCNTENGNLTQCNLLVSNEDLHQQVKNFWEIESCEYAENTKANRTTEEQECEKHFLENYKRNEDGRFVVKLPTRDNYMNLGDSKTKAMRRFLHLEKRFNRDSNFKQNYVRFIQEYEDLGHMSLLEKEEESEDMMKYYLAHHGVFKEDSTTTKLRVVFDASMASSSGLSLNDVLKTGPILQDDLFSIILRFRLHNVVLIADIEKMYRQIDVEKSDRNLQLILWRADSHSEIRSYQLNTVTYGMSPSSFLAVRSLQQAAIDAQNQYPEASNIILQDFYVDDMLTGSDTPEHMSKLKNEIVEILNSARFPLRKFSSNCKEVLRSDDTDEAEIQDNYIIDDNKNIKTLGLTWNPNQDSFVYTINIKNVESITKRNILSVVSRIFDPLGLLGPIMVRAKLILQNIWRLQIGWDDPLGGDISSTWRCFCEGLSHINNFQIPRQVTVTNYSRIYLHGFSDASISAFCACVYVVSIDDLGNHSSQLLCSKTRIAPLKTISLPRLELNGAVLLANLMKKAECALGTNIEDKYYWCDSTIVLCWINKEPVQWKTYVANRVSIIQNLTDIKKWFHVKSNQNPADVLSRGSTVQDLSKNKHWWFGPEFILDFDADDLHLDLDLENLEIPEQRQVKSINLMTQIDTDIFNKYSSFVKLQRIVAYVLRFINNTKNRSTILSGNLSTLELRNSFKSIIKMSQFKDFHIEIDSLKRKGFLSKKSRILSLNPFLDSDGLVRVGGRLDYADISYDRKHPYLLSAKNSLTRLLIEYEHKRLLHAGAQAVHSSLRNRVWIIDGKNCIKGILRKCITCFRAKPSEMSPLMGALPKPRLQPTRPFTNVGVDMAGPFLIKDSTFRNRKLIKSYVCIFICFCTKAVHLELISDLTTETFLNALRRFISRRGICKNIYSDNGLNFVGANRELATTYRTLKESLQGGDIYNFLSENEIQWHFNPPRSPHHGGLWERAVRSFKYHFSRVVGNSCLTFEHMYTILCQIEGILNSRPLTDISSDPHDPIALTPSHFLIGECLTALPEMDHGDIPVNRLKLHQHLQQMTRHFWNRWSHEYLVSLQRRTKWKTNEPNQLQIGSVVILHDEQAPVSQWRLGRITGLHPGGDGIVRVVSVKTKTGLFKRSVNKISLLPIDND